MPVGVAGGCAAIGLDGKVYVFGGKNASIANIYMPQVQIYDPSTNTWSLGASMPEAVTIADAVAMPNGLIYVMGGNNGSDPILIKDIMQVYDPVANSWTFGPSMPTEIYSGSAVAINDNTIMYLGGGNSDSSVSYNTIMFYNIRDGYWYTSSWTLPEKMAATDAVIGPDGQIYLIGGGRGNSAWSTNSYTSYNGYCFNPFKGETISVPDMTQDRKYHSVGFDEEGNIFVIGGYSFDAPVGETTANASKLKVMDLQLQVFPQGQDIITGEQMLVIADFNFAFADYESVTAQVNIRNSDGDVVAMSELSAYVAEGNPGYYWVDVPQGLPSGDYSVEFSKLRPSYYPYDDLSFDGFDIGIGFVHSQTMNEQLEAQNQTINDLQDQVGELQNNLSDANDKLDAAATYLLIVMVIAIIAVIVAVVVLVLSLRKKA
ncbi:MAG: hypothetical protein NT131_03710 [Methanomassiliicoccales archaeon]|nr:hypothetical protein [Methanomassiliicoccales archaeon]